MKSFNDLRNNETIMLEERFLRKGAGLLFADQARSYGQKA